MNLEFSNVPSWANMIEINGEILMFTEAKQSTVINQDEQVSMIIEGMALFPEETEGQTQAFFDETQLHDVLLRVNLSRGHEPLRYPLKNPNSLTYNLKASKLEVVATEDYRIPNMKAVEFRYTSKQFSVSTTNEADNQKLPIGFEVYQKRTQRL